MKAEQYPYGLMPSGYGHYSYLIMFRGKEYRTTTDNMPAVDDFKSEDDERRHNRGAKSLRDEAIRRHNLR